LDEREILEAAGAAVAADDLLDRAAEVDVDELGLEDVGDEGGGFLHGLRFGAEDLDADRAFVLAEAELADGGRVVAADAFCREELGDDDIGAPGAAEPAEWGF